MSSTPKEPTEAKLKRQIAECEAMLESLREKLAKHEAKTTRQPAPETGLDVLWKASPEVGRTRSTKQQCRTAFHRIPLAERPTLPVMLEAMAAWRQCDAWLKDRGAYIPALHRWIANRAWESAPAIKKAPSLYRSPVKPLPPQGEDSEPVSIEEMRAILGGGLKRMNS